MAGTAWINPYTFVPLEVLTAAKLNAMQDNLRAMKVWAAAGDLLYAYDNDQLERLPIGASGKILTSLGGVPAWSDTVIVNKRQGGSATDWTTVGSTAYDVVAPKILIGAAKLEFVSAFAAAADITFPSAFSALPMVFLSSRNGPGWLSFASADALTTGGFTIGATAQSTITFTYNFLWMAIGPA